MAVKTILVTGATGQQGRAFISSLFSSTSSASPEGDTFHVLALTRNPASPSAQALASKYPASSLTVVQGDLDDYDSIHKLFLTFDAQEGVVKEKNLGQKIWGVFCVLMFPGLGKNADGEEKQGKTLANLAHEFRVEHYIFSSVERGGEKDDDKAVLDRMAKVRIENHIKDLGGKPRDVGGDGLKWTILRPGFFMENFDGTLGSITFGVLKTGLKPDTKLQLIAASDIGVVAASIFNDPSPYVRKTLVVVGDTLTMREVEESYKRGSGKKKMPALGGLFAGLLIKMNGFTKDLIADMERVNGNLHDESSNAPILEGLALTVQANPQMTTFEEWVRRRTEGAAESGKGNAKDGKREKGWNGLSVGKVVTGKV